VDSWCGGCDAGLATHARFATGKNSAPEWCFPADCLDTILWRFVAQEGEGSSFRAGATWRYLQRDLWELTDNGGCGCVAAPDNHPRTFIVVLILGRCGYRITGAPASVAAAGGEGSHPGGGLQQPAAAVAEGVEGGAAGGVRVGWDSVEMERGQRRLASCVWTEAAELAVAKRVEKSHSTYGQRDCSPPALRLRSAC
jgi:hypothetical protein